MRFSSGGSHGVKAKLDEKCVLVLVTPLRDQELGDDVLLRLAKRNSWKFDQWQIVRSLFEAQAVDPRLTQHAWIAETLLETIPANGFAPARGGFLDAETVWPILLRARLAWTKIRST